MKRPGGARATVRGCRQPSPRTELLLGRSRDLRVARQRDARLRLTSSGVAGLLELFTRQGDAPGLGKTHSSGAAVGLLDPEQAIAALRQLDSATTSHGIARVSASAVSELEVGTVVLAGGQALVRAARRSVLARAGLEVVADVGDAAARGRGRASSTGPALVLVDFESRGCVLASPPHRRARHPPRRSSSSRPSSTRRRCSRPFAPARTGSSPRRSARADSSAPSRSRSRRDGHPAGRRRAPSSSRCAAARRSRPRSTAAAAADAARGRRIVAAHAKA